MPPVCLSVFLSVTLGAFLFPPLSRPSRCCNYSSLLKKFCGAVYKYVNCIQQVAERVQAHTKNTHTHKVERNHSARRREKRFASTCTFCSARSSWSQELCGKTKCNTYKHNAETILRRAGSKKLENESLNSSRLFSYAFVERRETETQRKAASALLEQQRTDFTWHKCSILRPPVIISTRGALKRSLSNKTIFLNYQVNKLEIKHRYGLL
jgi:hypothetical protein